MNPAPAINIWREGVHAPMSWQQHWKVNSYDGKREYSVLKWRENVKERLYLLFAYNTALFYSKMEKKNKNKNKSSSFQGKTIFYIVIQK